MAQNPIEIDDTLDGEAFTGMVNAAFEAVSTLFYGASDPRQSSQDYNVTPGFMWWHTGGANGTDVLKVWDGRQWVQLLKIDGNPGSVLQGLLDAKLDLSGGTMTGSLILAADPTQNLEAATKQYVDAASHPDSLAFLIYGEAAVGDNFAARLIDKNCTLTTIRARVGTAPTGAGLTIRISKIPSGSSTPSGSASVTIPAGSTEASASVSLAFSAGDLARLDITSIGSTVAGGSDIWIAGTCTA